MITFTRASIATYVDAGGSLRVAQENEPRFEAKGILMEGSSTNLSINSSNISPQVQDQSRITYKTDDMGTYAEVALLKDSWALQQILESTANRTYTGSFWVKCDDGFEVDVVMDFQNGTGATAGSTRHVGTGEWTRVSATGTSGTAAGMFPKVRNVGTGSVGKTIYVRFCQVEALPFATSYIQTNGAPVTRAADDLVLSPEAFPDFERPISIMIEGSTLARPKQHTYPVLYSFLSKEFNHDDVDQRSTFLFYGHNAYGDDRLGAWVNTDGNVVATSGVDSTIHRRLVLVVEGGHTQLRTSDGINLVGEYSNIKKRLSKVVLGGAIQDLSRLYGHLSNFRTWDRKLESYEIDALMEQV